MMDWLLPLNNQIDSDWMEMNKIWLDTYISKYHILRDQHSLYKSGWSASALTYHRFIPRLVWWVLSKYYKDDIILDFGTYDGTLVKALRESEITAFGYDEHQWVDMWNLLDVSQWINFPGIFQNYSIIVALNIAHNWTPSKFLQYIITDVCKGSCPKIILADRDQFNPHPNNQTWNDSDIISKAGFISYSFSQAKLSRDLLVWRSA